MTIFEDNSDEVVFDLTTKLKLTILQGKDLAAKDLDLLGKRSSSDPYVEIWAYNVLVGTTAVKKKTLHPDWRSTEEGETFYMSLEGEYTHDILLKIYDWNKRSDPELMGVITLKVKPKKVVNKVGWLTVPKDSAPHASGYLRVKMNTKILKPVGWTKTKKNVTKQQQQQQQDGLSSLDTTSQQSQQTGTGGEEKGRYRPSAAFHVTAFDDSFIGIEWSDDEDVTSNSNNKHQSTSLYHHPTKQHRNRTNQRRRRRASTVEFLSRQADFATKMNKVRNKTTQVKLIVFQGSDLAAKDYNFLGHETTSDPYVEVWVDHDINAPRMIGRTPTCSQTLDPIWIVPNKRAPPTFTFPITGYHTQQVKLKIWDEDYGIGETDDLMGIVTIPLTPPPDKDPNDELDGTMSTLQTIDTKWYDIPPNSAKGAKGSIKVGIIMQDITKETKSKKSRNKKKKKKGDKKTKQKKKKDTTTKKKRTSEQYIDHTEDKNENFLSIIEPVQQKTTKLQLTIYRGRGLKAVKKDWVGLGLALKKSNPNPYVEVSAYDHIVGTSRTIQKEVDPNWEVNGHGERFNMRLWGDHPHEISLKVYHEHADDRQRSRDDPDFYLGNVTIQIQPENVEKKEWYKVEKNADNTKETAGLLQVKIDSIVLLPEKKKKKNKKGRRKGGEKTAQTFMTKEKADNFFLDKVVNNESNTAMNNMQGHDNDDDDDDEEEDYDSSDSSDIYFDSSDDDGNDRNGTAQ